ncbi:MAG: clan AA aspartic protease [bacterium]
MLTILAAAIVRWHHDHRLCQFQLRSNHPIIDTWPKRRARDRGDCRHGVNGSLTLSSSLIASLGLRFDTRGRAILADGSEIFFDIYEASISWDGKPYRIAIAEAESEPLVGMKLLSGYELTIHIVEDGNVVIEKLS